MHINCTATLSDGEHINSPEELRELLGRHPDTVVFESTGDYEGLRMQGLGLSRVLADGHTLHVIGPRSLPLEPGQPGRWYATVKAAITGIEVL
jgi:hypothetical protein